MGNGTFTKLLEPAWLGGVRLPNRVIMAPMGSSICTEDGGISDRVKSYLVRRARGGVGLLTTEAACVDFPLGSGDWLEMRIDHDRFVTGHSLLTEEVHSYGAKILIQLHHAGRATNPHWTQGLQPVAPSPVARHSATAWRPGYAPRELTTEEVEGVIQRFIEAAARSQRAGYDGVNLHGAHGYIIHQFLSAKTNLRTDKYGGSRENRLRFATEMVQGIKKVCGKDFMVIFRLSIEGGYDVDECLLFFKPLELAGVDAFDIDTSGISPSTAVPYDIVPMGRPQGYILHQTARAREVTQAALIAVNEIKDPWFAENLLREGKFDFIMLGRALLSDPDWVKKVAEGKVEDIIPCPSCDHCLGGWVRTTTTHTTGVHCAINVETGREWDLGELEPATSRKRVVVVGGGLAGMEAARVATLRGHHVSLYEKNPVLGGALRPAAAPPLKERLLWFKDYLARQLKKLGVDMHLQTEVTRELVATVQPDVLILATGATPLVPQVPGMRQAHVLSAVDVLTGKVKVPGSRVVVLGGDETACETAETLAQQGHSVTLAAPCTDKELASNATGGVRRALLMRLHRMGIPLLLQCQLKEARPGQVLLTTKDGQVQTVEADVVVLALGFTLRNELAEKGTGQVPEIYLVGDSNGVRTIADAVYEGHMIARRL